MKKLFVLAFLLGVLFVPGTASAHDGPHEPGEEHSTAEVSPSASNPPIQETAAKEEDVTPSMVAVFALSAAAVGSGIFYLVRSQKSKK